MLCFSFFLLSECACVCCDSSLAVQELHHSQHWYSIGGAVLNNSRCSSPRGLMMQSIAEFASVQCSSTLPESKVCPAHVSTVTLFSLIQGWPPCPQALSSLMTQDSCSPGPFSSPLDTDTHVCHMCQLWLTSASQH